MPERLTLWQAAAGSQSLDLNAASTGSAALATGFASTVGVTYRLAFEMAGNTGGAPAVKTMQVYGTGGSVVTESFDATGKTAAAVRQKLADQWLDLQKTLGEETTTRSVTRRILAVLIVVPFVALVLAAAVAYPFYPEYSKFLLELAQSQFELLALGVAGFYFGPYMFGYLKK